MELPDCRADFLDISVLNSCEQYAKAGSSLSNHVVKKALNNCTLRACWLSSFFSEPTTGAHISAIFSYVEIFSSYPKETQSKESLMAVGHPVKLQPRGVMAV